MSSDSRIPDARLFPVAVLLLLAALSFWLDYATRAEYRQPGVSRHDPDYFAERFSVRRFDAGGRLQHTLRAERMDHFPDDDTTHVKTADVLFHGARVTRLTAPSAVIGPDGKDVRLSGGVRVIRAGIEGAPDTVIDTPSLLVLPDAEQASTSEPVVVTQGRSTLRGTGAEIDHAAGLTLVHGRVTGTFHRLRRP